MERPEFFAKPVRGQYKLPSTVDIGLIQETIAAALLDRIYAPLFLDHATDSVA